MISSNISENIFNHLESFMITEKYMNKFENRVKDKHKQEELPKTTIFFNENEIDLNIKEKKVKITQNETKIYKEIGKENGNGKDTGKEKGKGNSIQKEKIIYRDNFLLTNNNYKPKQKDSLFWCFYILKYGISKYEMEIGNQYFVVEKKEKFDYINILRNNKNILKMHKIKPLSEIEDDLGNKDRITLKTFIALCLMEKINIIVIEKRKIYDFTLSDNPKINIVHHNSISHENYIELSSNDDKVTQYRNEYYKMNTIDNNLKSITSYKLDELIEICNKLNINIEKSDKKKTKKDIYELIILNY
jgi:hypothetical protein